MDRVFVFQAFAEFVIAEWQEVCTDGKLLYTLEVARMDGLTASASAGLRLLSMLFSLNKILWTIRWCFVCFAVTCYSSSGAIRLCNLWNNPCPAVTLSIISLSEQQRVSTCCVRWWLGPFSIQVDGFFLCAFVNQIHVLSNAVLAYRMLVNKYLCLLQDKYLRNWVLSSAILLKKKVKVCFM